MSFTTLFIRMIEREKPVSYTHLRKFKENGIRFEYLSKPDNELPVTQMMEAFADVSKRQG